MIIAVTGHRPNKTGGYDWRSAHALMTLAREYLAEQKPDKVISGMALGWDTAVARAALFQNIPFIAAIPFAGQDRIWPKKDREMYADLLQQATEVHTVSPGGYAGWKMQARNKFMVDHCDKLLVLWDGSSGGTANCIEYAEQQHKPYDNLWERWINGTQRTGQGA